MFRRFLWTVTSLAALAAAPAGVFADDLADTDPVVVPVSDPQGAPSGAAGAYPAPDLEGKLDLSLSDALAMGLENNLGVEIQRHAPLIAHEDYRTAWGAYDPEWFSEFGWSKVKNPTANFILGAGDPTDPTDPISQTRVSTLDGVGGFRGLVPWLGASYEMSLTGARQKDNVTVLALSPELRSEVSFIGTVPLMRGLIWNEPWTLVKTTHVLERASREEFRRDLMDTIQLIENGYWALIADDERVRVAEKSLETAEALLDQVQIQFEVGVVSKVEIAEADAGVAGRDFDLIVARNLYRTTMDLLIDLVLGTNLTADSRIEINPTDRPDDYVTYQVDVEQAAKIAFQNRPELAIANYEIELQKLNLKFAKNQRLPSLDAVVSYGNRGLAGEPKSASIASLGGFGDSFDGYFTRKASDQFAARAILSIPFPNTVGRHGVSKANLELRRAEISKRRVEQDIILEIRKAARDLESAQQGIEASDRQQVAAAEQLRAERVRLEYGESTPFDVLLREQDLVSAEQGYIGALQAYRDSVTGLDRSQGTILRNRNIQIDDASRLR